LSWVLSDSGAVAGNMPGKARKTNWLEQLRAKKGHVGAIKPKLGADGGALFSIGSCAGSLWERVNATVQVNAPFRRCALPAAVMSIAASHGQHLHKSRRAFAFVFAEPVKSTAMVLFKFNEGYTNAVKRPVLMSELMGSSSA